MDKCKSATGSSLVALVNGSAMVIQAEILVIGFGPRDGSLNQYIYGVLARKMIV